MGFRGGYWNVPRPTKAPPQGTEWVAIRNADGSRIIGWKAKPLGTGGSGGGGGGVRYVGGGGGKEGLSAYIQRYRMMFGDPNANPPKDLLQKAKDGNWSDAYWQFMVRQKDPKYFRSDEAKKKLADLGQYMKAIGIGFNKSFAKEYLREGWTMTQLQNRVTKLKEFKQKYPHWAAFTKAQRAQGAAKQANPLAYQAYKTTFRNAFQQAGVVVPEGYERSFFKSGISDDEFIQNFSLLGQTQQAANWDLGGLSQQQHRTAMFSGKGAGQLRTQLQQALQKQQRFFQSQAAGFGAQQDNGLITVKGI
jgi:hypothetical protein